jgi:predicted patatin/cPLA2 family phospholipase
MLPVIQHILDRRDRPALHRERKLGLVVQGGCMRGVFTAGALCALEDLGVRHVFDAIYGSSAGAINAGYFLAGQIAEGTSIYYSEINNRTFIDFRRIWKGTAVDIDFCFDEVVGRRKRLDLDRILRSPAILKIYVTNAHSFQTECFAQREVATPDGLLTLLKASAAMPLVYRKRVLYQGNRYLDGGLLNPVPLLEAIEDGCSDILVLLSRPLDSAWKPPGAGFRRLIVGKGNRAGTAKARAAWTAGEERLDRTLALLRRDSGPGSPGFHLAAIAPPAGYRLTRWTTDRRRLVDAAHAGMRSILELFNGAAKSNGDPRLDPNP